MMRGVALALLVALTAGCGASAIDRARQTLAAGQTTVKTVDAVYVYAYRQVLEQFESDPELAGTVAAWDAGVSALVLAKDAFLLAEQVLDAWESGSADETDFLAAASCALVALQQLRQVVETLGLDVVLPAIDQVIALGGKLLGPMPACGGELATV